MVPAKSENWKLTKSETKQSCIGFFSNNNLETKAQFECGAFQFTVNHITLSNFAMLGPPVLPLIPLPVPNQNSLSIAFNHTDDKGIVTKPEFCPTPIIHSPHSVDVIKADKGGPYIYNCRYKLNNVENNSNEFIISFKLLDNNCETDKLHFYSFTKKEYCMLFSPSR